MTSRLQPGAAMLPWQNPNYAWGYAQAKNPNEIQTSGLTRAQEQAIARMQGFQGDFGEGRFQKWLTDTGRGNDWQSQLSFYAGQDADPNAPGIQARADSQRAARAGGYLGDFGGGGYSAFKAGRADPMGNTLMPEPAPQQSTQLFGGPGGYSSAFTNMLGLFSSMVGGGGAKDMGNWFDQAGGSGGWASGPAPDPNVGFPDMADRNPPSPWRSASRSGFSNPFSGATDFFSPRAARMY